jgi:hypothetical protein
LAIHSAISYLLLPLYNNIFIALFNNIYIIFFHEYVQLRVSDLALGGSPAAITSAFPVGGQSDMGEGDVTLPPEEAPFCDPVAVQFAHHRAQEHDATSMGCQNAGRASD